jgi:hypothetical protein
MPFSDDVPNDLSNDEALAKNFAVEQAIAFQRNRWSPATIMPAVEMGIDMSSPRVCADGWTIKVHPDGWRYFYSPGIVTDDLELAQHPPSDDMFKRDLDDDDYEEYFMQPTPGNKLEKAYINHALGYASSFKRRVDGSEPSAELGESVL